MTDNTNTKTSAQATPLAATNLIGQAVHVLVIEHDHGTEISVYADATKVQDALYDWAITWWDHEFGPDDQIPTDKEEAIEAYFDGCSEFYTSVTTTITA